MGRQGFETLRSQKRPLLYQGEVNSYIQFFALEHERTRMIKRPPARNDRGRRDDALFMRFENTAIDGFVDPEVVTADNEATSHATGLRAVKRT
ncbi:MAG: hypothetical protein ABIR28_09420 [Vicinamibacteria bacterium]